MSKFNVVKEFFQYVIGTKKFWLLPVILFTIVIGVLVVLTAESTLVPLVYALF